MNIIFVINGASMQIKKDDVRLMIDNAALKLFAEKGFKKTAMADISRIAGVPVGNIYNYYSGKEQLFQSIIDPLYHKFDNIFLKNHDRSLHSGKNYNDLLQDIITKRIDLIVEYRLHIIILLEGCSGTKYADLKKKLVKEYTKKIQILTRQSSSKKESNISFILNTVYSNLISGLVNILKSTSEQEKIRNLVDLLFKYHFKGIWKAIE